MSERKEVPHKAIFQKLKQLSATLSPQIAMPDCEAAIENALKTVFPGVRITRCKQMYYLFF